MIAILTQFNLGTDQEFVFKFIHFPGGLICYQRVSASTDECMYQTQRQVDEQVQGGSLENEA